MPDNDPLRDFGEIAISPAGHATPEDTVAVEPAEELPKKNDSAGSSPPEVSRPFVRQRREKGKKKKNSFPLFFGVTIVCVAVVYYLAGTYLFPAVLLKYGPAYLTRRLQLPVTVAAIRFSPFSFMMEINEVRIGDGAAGEQSGGDLFSCNRIALDLEAVSLFHMALITKGTVLDHPVVRLVHQKEGNGASRDILPFSLLRSFFSTGLVGADEASLPFRFSLNNFQVKKGKVFLEERAAGKKHVLDDINVTLPAVANFHYQTEILVEPAFHAVIDGSPLDIAGETTQEDGKRQTTMTLHLRDIDLPRYLAYLWPEDVLRVLQGKGTIDARLVFSSPGGSGATTFLVETTATFADIRLANHRGMDFIRIPSMAFHAVLHPQSRKAVFHTLVVKHPELLFERDAAPSSLKNELFSFGLENPAAFLLFFKRVLVQGGVVRFVDRKVAGGFGGTWHNVQLEMKNFSSRGNGTGPDGASPLSPASFVFSAASKDAGNISAQGTVSGESKDVAAFVVVDAVPLQGFQPYYRVPEKNGYVFTGLLQGEGNVAFSLKDIFRNPADTEKKGSFHLEKGRFIITRAGMTAAGRVLADVDALSASDVVFDLASKKAHLGLLRVDGPVLSLPSPVPEDLPLFPFAVSVQNLILERGRVRYEQTARGTGEGKGDTAAAPMELHDISLQGKDVTLSRQQNTAGGLLRLQGKVPSGGSLRMDGMVSFFPLRGTLTTSLEDGDLSYLGRFFPPVLQPGSWQGSVSLAGKTRLSDLVFSGKGEINDMRFVPGAGGEDKGPGATRFFFSKKVRLEGLEMFLATGSAKSREVTLENPVLPLSCMFSGTPADHGPEREKGPWQGSVLRMQQDSTDDHVVFLDKIRIIAGTVLCDALNTAKEPDHTVKQVAGSVSNLANVAGSTASYTFTGLLDDVATLSSSGTFRMGPVLNFEETQTKATALPLAVVSSFMERHFGWTVRQGNTDLSWQFSRRNDAPRVMARVGLEKWLLKKKTPAALDLSLAHALLTDEKGRADIVLELSPDKKSVGHEWQALVVRHIRNMALQTQVSPFLLLRQSFPSLATSVSFAPGSAVLDDQGRQTALFLERMLARRPGVAVVINAVVDQVHDRKALEEKKQARLHALERKETFKAAEKNARVFGREEIAPVPSVSPAARGGEDRREQTAQPVTRDELRQLGTSRIAQVFSYLVDELRLSPDRITKGKVRLFPGDRTEKSTARVDFQLRTGGTHATASP